MDDQESDDALMARFCRGDEAAFGVLYDRYAPQLEAFLRRLVRDQSLAEDLLQTTFLSFVRARGRYVATVGLRAWIFSIAANAGRDALRRRGARREDALGPEIGNIGGASAAMSDPPLARAIEDPAAPRGPTRSRVAPQDAWTFVPRGRLGVGDDRRRRQSAGASRLSTLEVAARTTGEPMTIHDAGSVSGSARERARAAALAELRRQPLAVSWRRDAVRTLLAVLGTTALVVGIGTWVSIVEPGRLGERLLQLALLVALQSLGIFAAIAPGRGALRWAGALVAVAAVAAILIGRGAGVPSAMPAIVCSGSHLAIDLIPLGLVLHSLRRFSWSFGRATLAGAAVAATGAVAGELICERGWVHALVHHVGAGVVIVAACVLVSRLIRPQTFAP